MQQLRSGLLDATGRDSAMPRRCPNRRTAWLIRNGDGWFAYNLARNLAAI